MKANVIRTFVVQILIDKQIRLCCNLEQKKRKMNIFSFFSGAGFLDLGFETQGHFNWYSSMNSTRPLMMYISMHAKT